MSKFRLPLISPLAGARLSILYRVLKGNRIAPKYFLKMGITVIVLLVSSAFQWLDRLRYRRKVNQFVFKDSPLFIIGHWRSGSTLLHNILSRDPSAGYVTTYQSVFPNNLKSKCLFRTFMKIFMPDERPGDQMKISVDLPQEDEYAMSNTSHRSFYHFFYFPTTYRKLYIKYIRFESIKEDEREQWKLKYRQMVIKALLNNGGKRAVLKNPVNTARMLPLLEIFPAANFIHIIRNPVIVYLSTKKFFGELFPTVNLENFSDEDRSSMILDLYCRLLKDYLSDRKLITSKKVLELRYEMLQEDPLREIEKIYSWFGWDDFKDLKPDFEAYLNTVKKHRSGSYSINSRELNLVTKKLGFAMKHWNYSIPEDLKIVEMKNAYAKKVPAL